MSKRQYLDLHHLCWTDGDGALHIDAAKACRHFGFEPTLENQDAIISGLIAGAKELMPGKPVTIVDEPMGGA